MKLILMRHCRSTEGERLDSSRVLTSKGIAQAKYMRQFRKDLALKFDVVFSSDFPRAVETADIVRNKHAPWIQLKQLRPDATPEKAFAAMYKAFELSDDTLVLVVTHNPLVNLMASVAWPGFSADYNNFPHGAMLRIDTHKLPPEKHPLHWLIRPGLIEHIYESDLVEAAMSLSEHLGRASKARIVDPLIHGLSEALGARFRTQGKRYARTKSIVLQQTAGFRRRFGQAVDAAYNGGALLVGATLGVMQEADRKKDAAALLLLSRQPAGYFRTAEDLESQIDGTTLDRIAAIEAAGIADGLTAGAIATRIREQFQEWAQERALTIATQEISKAFHTGGADVAKIVNQEAGGSYVQKAWDAEPDACDEICIPNMEDGWIDEDILFVSGDSEPPGHPNCRCSLSYRTVGQQSEESRR